MTTLNTLSTLNAMNTLKHFIIGSSLPVCFITFVYNGMAFAKSGRPSNVPYEYIPIVVPLLFGLANVFMFKIRKSNPVLGSKWWYPFAIGAVTGLIFSFIGRFGFNLPTRIFTFTKKTAFQVHLYAPVLYALIFGLIVNNLNTLFLN